MSLCCLCKREDAALMDPHGPSQSRRSTLKEERLMESILLEVFVQHSWHSMGTWGCRGGRSPPQIPRFNCDR
ncbi:hypothetical protein SRHO_G00286330 [Serrasalmus rhombeus]